MIKSLLIIILSIQILSASVPDQDTTNPKILTAHDTVSDTIGVSVIISDTFYLNDQQEELNNESNSSRVSSRCVLDCNLMIQFRPGFPIHTIEVYNHRLFIAQYLLFSLFRPTIHADAVIHE